VRVAHERCLTQSCDCDCPAAGGACLVPLLTGCCGLHPISISGKLLPASMITTRAHLLPYFIRLLTLLEFAGSTL
jgi:hypothetical protein